MNYKDKLLDPSQPIVVAIDGASATGKGAIAKQLAERFNLVNCQTGIFYRSLAYNIFKEGISADDTAKIIDFSKKELELSDDAAIYNAEVTDVSSKISAIPEVREALIAPQKKFIEANPRIVIEGRDIGTVIAPNADLKLFVIADIDVRAKRRLTQIGSGDLEDIKKSLIERDTRDSGRAIAPLKKAEDALIIDNSSKSLEEIVESLIK